MSTKVKGNALIADRNYSVDLLRIVAAFAIVVIHVSSKNIYNVPTSSNRFLAFCLYDLAVRWAVPVFVMISGIFFLDVNRKFSIKKLWTKNILRLVTAYVFWSFIYAVEHDIMHGYTFKELITDFIHGESFFWFLIMLITLYIYTPFLRKIVEDKKMEKYFLIVSGVLFCVFPTIISFTGNGHFKTVSELFQERSDISLVCGIVGVIFSFYYVLGHYLHNAEIKKSVRIILYISAVVFYIISALITVFESRKNGWMVMYFYKFYNLATAVQAAAVFVFFDKLKLKDLKDSSKKFIFTLSKCSFGIYLIHNLFVDGFDFLGIKTTSFNSFLSVAVFSILIFILSFICSFIINKIPVLKKYVV